MLNVLFKSNLELLLDYLTEAALNYRMKENDDNMPPSNHSLTQVSFNNVSEAAANCESLLLQY